MIRIMSFLLLLSFVFLSLLPSFVSANVAPDSYFMWCDDSYGNGCVAPWDDGASAPATHPNRPEKVKVDVTGSSSKYYVRYAKPGKTIYSLITYERLVNPDYDPDYETPTDDSCLEKSGLTHIENVSKSQVVSGAVTTTRVSKDGCEYAFDPTAPNPLDCYQKTDGTFQCYLSMTPENAGNDELDAVEPIEGDGDSIEVEGSTEQDNDNGINIIESTTIDKEPDGSTTTTETSTETKDDGTVTETVTEKKENPDGTVTTIINQTVTNPDGTTETTISGSKTETPENDEDNRSAALNDCGQPLQCKGDAIDCAMVEQLKKSYCATEKGLSDTADLIEQNTGDVGNLGDPNLDLTDSTEINVADQISGWQDVGDPTPGQCPQPRELVLGLGTFQVKWEPWCEFAETLRPFTIFMFSFIGAMAIARTFTA